MSRRLTTALVWTIRVLLILGIIGLIWASWLPAIKDTRHPGNRERLDYR